MKNKNPHSPGSTRTAYAERDFGGRKKKAGYGRATLMCELHCRSHRTAPGSQPWSSSSSELALTYLRHLGRPLRAANRDPGRVVFFFFCFFFPLQAARQAQSSSSTDSYFKSAEFVPEPCNFWGSPRWCRFPARVREFFCFSHIEKH